MAGKQKGEAQTASWVGEVEKYSRQIWLAGLGAYSKVSHDGEHLFDTLVADGVKAEALVKAEVSKQLGAVKSSVGSARSKVELVKEKAMGKWNELEEAFDKRLHSAIGRLGLPEHSELKALHSKVDALTKQLEKLAAASGSAVKPAAKPRVRKAPAKPATTTTGESVVSKTAAKPALKKVVRPAATARSAKAGKPLAAGSPAVSAEQSN
jgi:poly(hydroxyalkanoate) granule-associated protein